MAKQNKAVENAKKLMVALASMCAFRAKGQVTRTTKDGDVVKELGVVENEKLPHVEKAFRKAGITEPATARSVVKVAMSHLMGIDPSKKIDWAVWKKVEPTLLDQFGLRKDTFPTGRTTRNGAQEMMGKYVLQSVPEQNGRVISAQGVEEVGTADLEIEEYNG